jgi:hypothetical protein
VAASLAMGAANETSGACGDEKATGQRPPSFGHWCGMLMMGSYHVLKFGK